MGISNLEGIITTNNKNLKLHDNEVLFEENNLFSQEKTKEGYVTKFKTNYLNPKDMEFTSYLDDLKNIPLSISEKYVEKVSPKVQKFADNLIGNEEYVLNIIFSFARFAKNNLNFDKSTPDKPIENILDEYEKTGEIKGNCKEIRTMIKSFCNAKGIPVKTIRGAVRTKKDGYVGHVWSEICVPLKDGNYKWFRFDPATKKYGALKNNYARSKIPEVKDNMLEFHTSMYNKIKKLF